MLPPRFIITLSLALSRSAFALPEPTAVVTPAPIMARDDTLDQCAKAVTNLNAPAPSDQNLASWLGDHDTGRSLGANILSSKKITNVDKTCAEVASITPPASLASAYSSYNDQLSTWHSSVAPTINSLAPKCTGSALAAGAFLELLLVNDDVAQCTNTVNKYNKALPNAGVSTPRHLAAGAAVAGLTAALLVF
ncbi:hypothetical protein VTI74DRAFT_9760 [Chaetomium olivicolor]